MSRLAEAVVGTLTGVLVRTSIVSEVVEQGPYRTITLAGDGLRGAGWRPGDKVQVQPDRGGLAFRTYTPTRWDADAGETELLAYLHGLGPGSAWARALAVGDEVRLFGPRRSLDLAGLDRAPIVVGDETSLALRSAWSVAHPDLDPVADLYEVTDPAAVAALDLAFAPELVARRPDDAHLAGLADAVVAAARTHPTAPLVLTGRSATIAAVRRSLKDAGLADRPTRAKAYWDPTRSGLD